MSGQDRKFPPAPGTNQIAGFGEFRPLTSQEKNKYLLLIEFEVRTVKYRPSFFRSIYGPSAKRAGHKSMGKNEDPYFTVRTEKTRLIRYLLYLSFWRKKTISSQSRQHLNDARVKCKKKAKFIGLRKQFAVGSQRRESKLQTF